MKCEENQMKKENVQIQKIVMMGMLIALSAIGAMIKIQGSIAFDSLAAFLGALVLGPVYGGIIGFIGHLLSAYLSGFVLTLPVHILVAMMMFVSCWAFGQTYTKLANHFNFHLNSLLAVIVAVLLNGPISLALAALYMQVFAGIPFLGVFVPMFIPLTIAALINVVLAIVLYKVLEKTQVWERK
jgi:uncharacterized membrane protein YesL